MSSEDDAKNDDSQEDKVQRIAEKILRYANLLNPREYYNLARLYKDVIAIADSFRREHKTASHKRTRP